MQINKKGSNSIVQIASIVNIVLISLPFVFVWYLYYLQQMMFPFYRNGNYVLIILYAVMYYFFAYTYEGFLVQHKRISELIFSQWLAIFITNIVFFSIVWLILKKVPSIILTAVLLIIQTVLIIVWSIATHRIIFSKYENYHVAIINDGKLKEPSLIKSYCKELGFKQVKRFSLSKIRKFDVLSEYDVIFLNAKSTEKANNVYSYCILNNKELYIVPSIYNALVKGSKNTHIMYTPMYFINGFNSSFGYQFIKRFFDILLSTVGLIIVFPLLLIVSMLIKLEDGGPIFYKQERLTKGGKVFEIIKFRSMKENAEQDGKAVLSSGDSDSRITRIGRFIRKTRIDEIPQIFNILKGDMSLVGPRPERPELVKKYEKTIPEFKLRLAVKAGLTGYAQVYGKYNTSADEKLKLDLMYLSKQNLFEDFKLLIITIKIIFISESTEGISDNDRSK